LQGGGLFTTPDGILSIFNLKNEPPFQITRATSTDNGQSWSEPSVVGELTFPAETVYTGMGLSRLLELRDGTLLMFASGSGGSEFALVAARRHYMVPPPGRVAVCVRSTDAGLSWSEPANLDGPPYDQWMLAKEAGSETSAAETLDGKIITLGRALFSPFMWESWSEDGGRTWTPVARGPFPMYACNNSMISTTSGALIIGGRFPGMGIQLSHDGGMTWQGYRIDTAIWANGAMFEVEPDVVLFIYGGPDRPREMRGQFLRVTSEGLEPASLGEPNP
jgi:hypothetical protein